MDLQRQRGRVIAVTIGLSVLAHGMSAPFLADRYGDWYDAALARTPALREAQRPADGSGRRESGPRRPR